MEISQKATEPKFEPVTIRLDTMQEVRAMNIIVSRSEVCVCTKVHGLSPACRELEYKL